MTSQADIRRRIRVFMITRAGILDPALRHRDQPEALRGHPHPGQKYKHGWIPVGPAATLPGMDPSGAPESVRDLPIEEVDPDRIQPLHDVVNEEKFDALVADMSEHGWRGAPVVTIPSEDYGDGPGDPVAITGSHRVAAAREAGIEIPTVDLDAILAKFKTSLADMEDEYGAVDYDDILGSQAISRLVLHIPDEVAEYFGFDLL